VIFRSELRDALWVNWALPRVELPELPTPLALDLLGSGEGEVGFLSLVLFRQESLRLAALPFPSLSFPQANLRLLVRDAERVASVLFVRELMPAWAVPIARIVARQPASAAIFHLRSEPGGTQSWSFAAGRPLSLTATPGAPTTAAPVAASWEEAVAFFRERPRGYVSSGRGLRRLAATHPGARAVPMRVEVNEDAWLAERLPGVERERWRRPHSSFLIPSMQLAVAVESSLEPAAGKGLPARERAAVT